MTGKDARPPLRHYVAALAGVVFLMLSGLAWLLAIGLRNEGGSVELAVLGWAVLGLAVAATLVFRAHPRVAFVLIVAHAAVCLRLGAVLDLGWLAWPPVAGLVMQVRDGWLGAGSQD